MRGPADSRTPRNRIFDAALFSGWKVHSKDDTGVTFRRDSEWLHVLWTQGGRSRGLTPRVQGVRKAILSIDLPDGRNEITEVIDGRKKAERVESILWSAMENFL